MRKVKRGLDSPSSATVAGMRYGLELPTGGVFADVRFLAELAALAERAGWDGVFVEDYVVHHIESDAPTVDPWIALAAMAVATQRIRIGPMVTPLPRRRPGSSRGRPSRWTSSQKGD